MGLFSLSGVIEHVELETVS